MKQQSHVSKNVEHVVSGFFETGQDEEKLHTLHLAGQIAPADKPSIESALSAVDGVEKIHVDPDNNNVYVIFGGPAAPLVEAMHNANFDVSTAH